ncbi:type II toxin-antitoxin system RelE/ParE family toxin [Bythopirellula goksoeyrii]|uniref:Plasmid stabilization system protein n=1 Tax=Bythopirellula goksoeyrii TaxID=1400387 RepID=A0A5B9QRX5_9BACT|nr:type II toxin-antitoxin system RelE/ParE family toxin [Bythopirellula goksoeyrii]QEG36733.1 Plasmid stabilization system protein [Bythopirellula goksoeyrii]
MTCYLQLTDEAADQLFAIAQWYAETSQSLEIAANWYDGLLDALETLEENPHRGELAAENDLFDFELRELCYGSGKHKTHRALYRIAGTRVEILSIRHLAQRGLSPTDLD